MNKITISISNIVRKNIWENSSKSPYIEDGFGNSWSKICPECGKSTMIVIRPGKVQGTY
jgi:hypothetical protein